MQLTWWLRMEKSVQNVFPANCYLIPLDFPDYKPQKPAMVIFTKKKVMESFRMRWCLTWELNAEKKNKQVLRNQCSGGRTASAKGLRLSGRQDGRKPCGLDHADCEESSQGLIGGLCSSAWEVIISFSVPGSHVEFSAEEDIIWVTAEKGHTSISNCYVPAAV